MKCFISFCLCCLFSDVYAYVEEAVSRDESVVISLSIDSNALAQGRIEVITKLLNTSKSVVEFLPWGTPFESTLNGPAFKVVDMDDGTELDYLGRMMKRTEPKNSDYLRVGQAGSISHKIEITDSYNFCRDKVFSIKVVSNLLTPKDELVGYETEELFVDASSNLKPCI